MAMAFDAIYGPINFAGREAELVVDLLRTAEVIRLRRMRLLNFDSLVFQDLATVNRLAHSIGVSFLASQLGRFATSEKERLEWIAAALIHDVGILPFGHLLEESLATTAPQFSHESLVRNIIRGTYHETNVYHQILPGRSLGINRVLKRYSLDVDAVIRLIQPGKGQHSILNAPLDIDNLDNIHRMVHLVGLKGARDNLAILQKAMSVRKGHLVFDSSANESISKVVLYRRKMYASMIAHPATVAYNALLLDLAEVAISQDLIHPSNWFLNDADFTELVKGIGDKSAVAQAYVAEQRYELIDYIWLHFDPIHTKLVKQVLKKTRTVSLPEKTELFVWLENCKIHRSVTIRRPNGSKLVCGADGSSLLLATIDKSLRTGTSNSSGTNAPDFGWRARMLKIIDGILPRENFRIMFPEEFDSSEYSLSNQDTKQMRLFDA